MKPLITVEGVSASYDGKKVLDNISLTIYDDDYLGIIGPNGGGKTTLVKVILGLKKPDCGNISFYRNGEKVEKIKMGYLPQVSNICLRCCTLGTKDHQTFLPPIYQSTTSAGCRHLRAYGANIFC